MTKITEQKVPPPWRAPLRSLGWPPPFACPSRGFSYISASFVIESLSVANASVNKKKQSQVAEYDDVVVSESGPSSFEITERIEISQMASMFLGRTGVIFSYVGLNVYLFGDLAIYSTTVPKSLMNIVW